MDADSEEEWDLELRVFDMQSVTPCGLIADMWREICTRGDEITQLRAELTAERELADRLAETVRSADYVIKSARPDSGWLVAYKDDIAAAYTRRNK